jgi:uncharacterized membrane protein YphA (DoxX/SURF4 family)
MRSLLENRYVVLSARLLLGFVFVVASIDKLADPNAFAVSISYYRLVGEPVTLILATILPWVELLAGLFLLFGIMMRGSSLLLLLMLAVFTAGVISGIARGLDISCGCFTRDPNVDKIGWMKVLENLGLIVLSLITLYAKSTASSVMQEHPSSRDVHGPDNAHHRH